MLKIKESDLYPPLKEYLISKNYVVKAEIQNCDVVAIGVDSEPIIIELKVSLNLSIIMQAVDRLSLSESVYIGIPNGLKLFKKQRKKILKLLKMLGLGLIIIDLMKKSNQIEILLEPSKFVPRISKYKQKRFIKEFTNRIGDPNLGGTSTRKGVITAYRQKAFSIAKYLEINGANKASIISKNLEISKARDILYKNVYGWFESVSRGIYNLSEKGKEEIKLWEERIKGS